MRRGSEPVVALKTSENNMVTTGSVQAAIACINARSTTTTITNNNNVNVNQVPRSMSTGIIKNNNNKTEDASNLLLQPSSQNNSLRSSLRKTMVNTSYGYSLPIEDRDCQQGSPDSQFEGDSQGSLSVMRRREPLGASGNKPERPK